MNKTKDIHDEIILYKKAIKTWGIVAQQMMMFEEMGELIQAICKYSRDDDNTDNIAEEIADVEIMLGQMKIMFDVWSKAESYKANKLIRLESRLYD